MLTAFRKTNASVGLHVMPIIPCLTDSYENIDRLYSLAKDSNVHYVLPGTLYLRGKTRTVFFAFIQKEFPTIYGDLLALYKTGGADKEYKNTLYKKVNEIRERYLLSNSWSKPMKEKYREY